MVIRVCKVPAIILNRKQTRGRRDNSHRAGNDVTSRNGLQKSSYLFESLDRFKIWSKEQNGFVEASRNSKSLNLTGTQSTDRCQVAARHFCSFGVGIALVFGL